MTVYPDAEVERDKVKALNRIATALELFNENFERAFRSKILITKALDIEKELKDAS